MIFVSYGLLNLCPGFLGTCVLFSPLRVCYISFYAHDSNILQKTHFIKKKIYGPCHVIYFAIPQPKQAYLSTSGLVICNFSQNVLLLVILLHNIITLTYTSEDYHYNPARWHLEHMLQVFRSICPIFNIGSSNSLLLFCTDLCSPICFDYGAMDGFSKSLLFNLK